MPIAHPYFHRLFLPRHARLKSCLMEVAMTESPNASASSSTQATQKQRPKEARNVWILTVYSMAGLAFFGVLAYYISNYFAQ